MKRRRGVELDRWGVAMAGIALATACGDEARPTTEMLDPGASHYGMTYAEWAVEWTKYTQGYTKEWIYPDCVGKNPVEDATGGLCRTFQDPTSPVFFLTGAFSNDLDRDECVIPQGKALFFPLLSISGDGTPSRELTDEDTRAYVEGSVDLMHPESLYATVDGASVPALVRGKVYAAPYSVDVPSPPNGYTCLSPKGRQAEGSYTGFAGGYWTMLAPLSPGRHQIKFGGESSGTTKVMGKVLVAVTYNAEVQ